MGSYRSSLRAKRSNPAISQNWIASSLMLLAMTQTYWATPLKISSRQIDDLARITGQFENVHARIGAVDDVDVTALVGLEIVGLDRDFAAILAIDLDAALVGIGRDRRDEIADLFGAIGIADIDGAHAGVEI